MMRKIENENTFRIGNNVIRIAKVNREFIIFEIFNNGKNVTFFEIGKNDFKTLMSSILDINNDIPEITLIKEIKISSRETIKTDQGIRSYNYYDSEATIKIESLKENCTISIFDCNTEFISLSFDVENYIETFKDIGNTINLKQQN